MSFNNKEVDMMKKPLFFLVLPMFVSLSLGCDSGSDTDSERVGESQCEVTLESNSSGFRVEMLLECDGPDYTDCYTIDRLNCGGEDIELAEPVPIESCSDSGPWCVNDCIESLAGGNGNIWDTPELLAIDACNTYER